MKKNVSYKDALEYLYSLQKYGIKFGLSKTSNLLKALGNPHLGQEYIHIAGSNGKGSVAAMMESVLIRAGLKVGFYSSPHLVRFTERFRINGREISQKDMTAITLELMDVINQKELPTFFEVTTSMALLYFTRKETDISIIEVGMGGRLDATNVIRPAVSVITNISLEHQSFLGSHLLDIASEKAGIIKRGVDLVTAATQPSVIQFLQATCEKRRAPFWRIGKDVRYRTRGTGIDYYGINRTLRNLAVPLHGRFQRRNTATALAALELLEKKGHPLEKHHIVEGLRATQWPGRMHVISEKPYILLDGAHNPAAIRTLADSIGHDFCYQRMILVIGVMEDKDIKKVVHGVVPMADYVVYTRPNYYRAANPKNLEKVGVSLGKPGESVPSIPEAIEKAKTLANKEDMILICGSLFTVGEALTYLDPKRFRPDPI